jgi:hypothetical protein
MRSRLVVRSAFGGHPELKKSVGGLSAMRGKRLWEKSHVSMFPSAHKFSTLTQS